MNVRHESNNQPFGHFPEFALCRFGACTACTPWPGSAFDSLSRLLQAWTNRLLKIA